jgi:hypothetical protein
MTYKKHNPANPLNYRNISLPNTVYELWTKVLTYVMYASAEQHQIITGAQVGFCNNCSTHRYLHFFVRQ